MYTFLSSLHVGSDGDTTGVWWRYDWGYGGELIRDPYPEIRGSNIIRIKNSSARPLSETGFLLEVKRSVMRVLPQLSQMLSYRQLWGPREWFQLLLAENRKNNELLVHLFWSPKKDSSTRQYSNLATENHAFLHEIPSCKPPFIGDVIMSSNVFPIVFPIYIGISMLFPW